MNRAHSDEYGFLFRVGNSNSSVLHLRAVVEVDKTEGKVKWRYLKPTARIFWEGHRRTMRVSKMQVVKDNAFCVGRKPVEIWLPYDSDEIVHAWDYDENGPAWAIPAEVLEETLEVLSAHIRRGKHLRK